MDFIDLKTQKARIADKINTAIATVLDHGQYIMGPEVRALETALCAFGGADHVVACANGTDAIILPLMAWGVGPGDAVFCPSFTYVATAEAIALLGATPVFVDIDRETYNMCPQSLEQAITQIASNENLDAKAVITVDLFGRPANYPAISKLAKAHELKLISDSAQGFGCTLGAYHPLHWADVTTTSFFPAKPLGCYGDGGAILTNDRDLAEALDSLRIHGKGTDKYDNVRIGMNSRLDSIQAAILIEKLKIFPEEIKDRMRIGKRYSDNLGGLVQRVPTLADDEQSTWAIYTIEVDDRDRFAKFMGERNIPTPAYYPKPVHLQSAYTHYPVVGNSLANTEAASAKVISLPMHAYLDVDTQDKIIDAIQSWTNQP